jgi:hypothetical protein
MDRYARGDDAAFADVYDAVAPRIHTYLLRQTRDRGAADDLLHSFVGGFPLLEAKDKAAAVELTRRFVEVHRRVLGASFQLECQVRQIEG